MREFRRPLRKVIISPSEASGYEPEKKKRPKGESRETESTVSSILIKLDGGGDGLIKSQHNTLGGKKKKKMKLNNQNKDELNGGRNRHARKGPAKLLRRRGKPAQKMKKKNQRGEKSSKVESHSNE